MASIDRRVSPDTGAVAYQVRYRTPDGKSRAKTFRLMRDAKQFAASVETVKATGDFVDPQRATVTVSEWAASWMAARTSLAVSTRARYQTIVGTHIVPRWGRLRLSQVTHEDVQQWVAELGERMAPASVRKVHRVLSLLLSYAVKSGRLARNPANLVDLPRVKSKPRRYLTHEQVGAFADAVGEDWRLHVLVLAYTGLRIGELVALRWRNVDLLRRRLIVSESASTVDGRLVMSDTKGHEPREVPLPRFLVPLLEAAMEGHGPNDLAFPGPSGVMLRRQTLHQSAFPRASAAIGIDPPLTPHELRHTAASLAIAAGADVKVVQQMLGHKSATMTLDLYGHLFPDRLDVVADAMDAARSAALGA